MSSIRNQVRLIGNLGADPEVKTLGEDRKMARFNLATNETYTNDKGEKVVETQWHNVVAWGKVVQVIEKYLKKGAEIAIDGKLITRSYNDKEGTKRFITEVVLSEVVMLGSKKSAELAEA